MYYTVHDNQLSNGKNTNTLYSKSQTFSLIPAGNYVLWHICTKQELWRQKKRPLLGNSMVTTLGVFYTVRATFPQQQGCRQQQELLEVVISMRPSLRRLHRES